MKKGFLFTGLIVATIGLMSSSEVTYPSVSNNAFQSGEKLRYRITYGFVDAGEAVFRAFDQVHQRAQDQRDHHHHVQEHQDLAPARHQGAAQRLVFGHVGGELEDTEDAQQTQDAHIHQS